MRTTIYIGLAILFILHGNDAGWILRSGYDKVTTFDDPDCLSTLKSDGISLVNYGITRLNSSIKISGRFYDALKDLYRMDINTVVPIVTNSFKPYFEQGAANFDFYLNVNEDKAAMYTYALTDYVSYYIPLSLEKHKCGKKELDNLEESLAPFTAYLMAAMLYSPSLQKWNKLTYKEASLDQEVIDQYKAGTTFVWPKFVSSYIEDRSDKGPIEFVFDNSRESIWTPKRLENYPSFPERKEVVYPPGAMFRVKEKRTEGEKTYIYVDLVSKN